MRIVDHAINYRRQMFRYADDQSSLRQFVGAQMHSTARPDLHRRCPHPAQLLHDALDRDFVDSRPRVADPTFPFAGAFVKRRAVHQIVDLLVRLLRCNGNRANNTISRLALVSGGPSSSIIQLKMSVHVSRTLLRLFPSRCFWILARSAASGIPMCGTSFLPATTHAHALTPTLRCPMFFA